MAEDMSFRRLRSWLFTPATRPDRFDKAAAVGADVLILDLEDAVAPADKDAARRTAVEFLERSSTAPIARALRVNGLSTRAGLADVTALLDSRAVVDFIVLSKTETAKELQLFDQWLSAAGKTVRLVALIESARALIDLPGIANATPRLAAMMFGAADMAADLGARNAWEPLVHARSCLLAAAALSGVTTIDAPFLDVRDQEGLHHEIERSIALGFAAKAAIHPSQVVPINTALTPDVDAIAEARNILAENEKGVGLVGGRMIDEAVARQARRTLAAAGARAIPRA